MLRCSEAERRRKEKATPRIVRGEGRRIGVQMIAQRLGRSIADAAIEQLFDESLLDELEKEVFLELPNEVGV